MHKQRRGHFPALPETERQQLQRLATAHTALDRLQRWSGTVLLSAEELGHQPLVAALGVPPSTGRKWRSLCLENGIDELRRDRPQRRQPSPISDKPYLAVLSFLARTVPTEPLDRSRLGGPAQHVGEYGSPGVAPTRPPPARPQLAPDVG